MSSEYDYFVAATPIILIILIIICIGVASLAYKLADYTIAIMDWCDSRKHPDYSGCQMWKFLTK